MPVTFTIEETGSLDKLVQFFDARTMERSIMTVREALLKQLAELYVEHVVAAIEAGDAGGPGLAPATSARKGHGRPWVDTRDLLRSIQARKLHDGTWHGGIPPEAKNRKGEPMDLIALILEIGSLTNPARPVFEPQAQRLAREDAKSIGVESMIIQSFGL
jgi:hypothetical protein